MELLTWNEFCSYKVFPLQWGRGEKARERSECQCRVLQLDWQRLQIPDALAQLNLSRADVFAHIFAHFDLLEKVEMLQRPDS